MLYGHECRPMRIVVFANANAFSYVAVAGWSSGKHSNGEISRMALIFLADTIRMEQTA
jgi:hypothetical protein